jgi:hypothetical protein
MPDDTKQPTPQPATQFKFEIVEPKDGPARIYANVSHLTWTGMDITVQLYELIQPNREIESEKGAPNELQHAASVTFTWNAAKTFNKMLAEVLDRYEKANGPIKTEFQAI